MVVAFAMVGMGRWMFDFVSIVLCGCKRLLFDSCC